MSRSDLAIKWFCHIKESYQCSFNSGPLPLISLCSNENPEAVLLSGISVNAVTQIANFPRGAKCFVIRRWEPFKEDHNALTAAMNDAPHGRTAVGAHEMSMVLTFHDSYVRIT